MFSRFIQYIFIIALLFSVQSFASTQYENYDVYQDGSGNIYLKLPKQFVLIHSDVSIPLMVIPNNGLLKLYQSGNDWNTQVITEDEFNTLSLISEAEYEIEYIDFSGDGDTEIILRSTDENQDSFIIDGLENGSVSLSVHNKNNTNDIDLSTSSTLTYTDINDDGYKDIVVDSEYGEYTLLGNAQDGFVSTAPIFTSGTTLVGSTAGEFKVSEDGAATYNIPLALPQGVAGVKPQLSISYSSNGGAGILGQGFNLSGISAISRCPKNYAQDGIIAGLSFTDDDRYCYNGQKLTLMSGTYGAAKSVYHTEIANFEKITIATANTSGALTFTVETKAGDTYTYGAQSVNAYTGNESAPSAYMLSSISDVIGNTINYNYTSVSSSHQEHNLSTITWDNHQAEIHYKENYRPSFSYQNGELVGNTRLIDTVDIKTDSEVLRRYIITWDDGVVLDEYILENTSRITAITECLIEGSNQHCLAPVNFNWSTPQKTGTSIVYACEEGNYPDCETPRVIPTTVTSTFTGFNTSPDAFLSNTVKDNLNASDYRFIGDTNGDGVSDVFYNNDKKLSIILSNVSSDGSVSFSDISGSGTVVADTSDFQYGKLVDLNGDGKVVLLLPYKGTWKGLGVNEYGYVGNLAGTIYYDDNEIQYTSLLDVNGDGHIDLVYKDNDTDSLYVNYNKEGTVNTTGELLLGDQINEFGDKIYLQTPSLKNSAFVDFNGDGISDFIATGTVVSSYVCSGRRADGTSLEVLYSGTSKSAAEAACDNRLYDYTDLDIVYTTQPQMYLGQVEIEDSQAKGDYTLSTALSFLKGLDFSTDVRIADFNGDGLSDIVYRASYGQWLTAVSKGDGTFSFNSLSTDINATDSAKYSLHRFMDMNSDGKTDILVYTGYAFHIYLAGQSSDGEVFFTNRGTLGPNVSSWQVLEFGDFNGDGNLDMLLENSSNVHIYYSQFAGVKQNSVNMIQSGFGQQTAINYEQVNRTDNYVTNDSDSYINGLAATRGFDNQNYSTDFASDFLSYTPNIWVVSKASDVGYNSDSGTSENLSVSYKYGGLLINKMGRGSLGFAKLETTDNQTSVVTTTTYSQQFPYVGMPTSTVVKLGSKTLSTASNTYKTSSASTMGIHPYQYSSSDIKYHYTSSGTTTFASHTYLSGNTFDAYGNVITSDTSQLSGVSATSTVLKKVHVVNVYNGDGRGAEKGRLSSSTVTHSGSTKTSKTLTSGFTYYSSGLLNTSTINNLTTTYSYDIFGNKNQVCKTDLLTNQQRCTTLNWSNTGRYLLSQSNDLNQSTSYLYNGLSGDVVTGRVWSKTTTNANKIASTSFFDIQGQVIRVDNADGTNSVITRGYSSSSNKYNCTSNTQQVCFYEHIESTAKPSSYTWYDASGRKIKTQVRGFDGSQWSSQSYTFDEYSRNKTSSVPYYESSANGNKYTGTDKTSYLYDVLGRVTTEILPNLKGENRRIYYGARTTYYDAEDKYRHEYINPLGQLYEVGSASADLYTGSDSPNTTSYIYDVMGNLERVENFQTEEPEGSHSIYTVFDDYGNKTDVYDPDKGHWQYSYNAFGELTSQTSATGVVTTKKYDVLGRNYRTETQAYNGYAAKLACNSYGTSSSAHNVGQLISQKQYSVSNSTLSSASCSASSAEWQQSQTFDELGRPDTTTTTFDGNTYSQTNGYDSYGRITSQTLPEGVSITTEYANKYVKRTRQNSYLLRQINSLNAAGRVLTETIADGISRTNDFEEGTGHLLNIEVKNTADGIVHNLTYAYDNVGNMTDRRQQYGNTVFDEDFTYDNLHRLIGRKVAQSSSYLPTAFDYDEVYKYDEFGNIRQKYSQNGSTILSNANYNYSWVTHSDSVSGKDLRHSRLNSVSGSKYRSFDYDNNGNVTADGSREYSYTGFDKPYLIASDDGQQTQFWYGPSKSRYMREDQIQEQKSTGDDFDELTTYKTHYLGVYERIERTGGNGNQIEHKYHVAGAVITRIEGASDYTRLFMHSDLQGSVISITDGTGNVAEQFIYDPWGKKSKIYISDTIGSLVTSMARGSSTTRGYTGHEGIDHFDLIHMNGRVYDADIGRFLQADPHIQAPNNSQSYNRYAYVLNNPMSYTDPSGYFFKKLGKFVKKHWRTIAAIVVSVYMPGMAAFANWSAAATGAVTGFVAGGIATGSLRGALVGAFTGAMFGGIHDGFAGRAMSAGMKVGKTLLHGMTGGIGSVLNGGKFGHGFAAAGFTQAISQGGDVFVDGDRVGNAIKAAAIGGTASAITGGKFANGAVTGAFSRLLNDDAISRRLPANTSDSDRNTIASEIYDDAETRANQLLKWQNDENWDAVRSEYGALSSVSDNQMYNYVGNYIDEFRTQMHSNLSSVTIAPVVNGANNVLKNGLSIALDRTPRNIWTTLATAFTPSPPPIMRHQFNYSRTKIDIGFVKR